MCFLYTILFTTVLSRPVCTSLPDAHGHYQDQCSLQHSLDGCPPFTTITSILGSPNNCAQYPGCLSSTDDDGNHKGHCHSGHEKDAHEHEQDHCASALTFSECFLYRHCHWEQECVFAEHYCSDYPTVCNASPDCHHHNGECHYVHLEEETHLTMWLCSAVILIVSIVSLVLPLVAERFCLTQFKALEPYISSISSGLLFSIAIVHLLSESLLYSTQRMNSYVMFVGTFMLGITMDVMMGGHHHSDINHSASSSSYGSDDDDDVLESIRPQSRVDSHCKMGLKYFGIIIHGVQEGIVMGFQEASVVWVMTAAILLHKALFIMSIAHDIRGPVRDNWFTNTCVFLFIMSTPLTLLICTYQKAALDTSSFGLLGAFSAGLVFKFSIEGLDHLPQTIKDAFNITKNSSKLLTSSSMAIVELDTTTTDMTTKGPSERHREMQRWTSYRYALHLALLLTSMGAILLLMMWHLSVHDHSEVAGEDHTGHNH